jgi:hypothetical protein
MYAQISPLFPTYRLTKSRNEVLSRGCYFSQIKDKMPGPKFCHLCYNGQGLLLRVKTLRIVGG